ncbi:MULTISPECIES: hypothetical protein [unclassified Sphingobium]|uniref:hypothetical protein n=1 Tax=unclassified Sphingobium TaxID=2611147 RepID=UPI0013054148|nr:MULTISPECIES: hypothetical protein [unclassified Sphingobium]
MVKAECTGCPRCPVALLPANMAERIFFAGAEQKGQPAVCGQLDGINHENAGKAA